MKQCNKGLFEINSVSEYIDTIISLLQNHQQSPSEDTKKDVIYFRGENAPYKHRVPNLYRSEALAIEGANNYYRELINELGINNISDGQSLFKTLSELQHYGAQTPFLDITSNPLVALYFATEDSRENKEKDGYIYIYKTPRERIKYPSGATVSLFSALNFLNPNDVNYLIWNMRKIYNFFKNSTIFEDQVTLSKKPKNSPAILYHLDTEEIFDLLISKAGHSLILSKEEGAKLKFLDQHISPSGTIGIYYQQEQARLKHSNLPAESIHKQIEINLLNEIKHYISETLVKITNITKSFDYKYPLGVFMDICAAHVISPAKDTDRIRQQQGAFIFPAYPTSHTLSEIHKEIGYSIASLQLKDAENKDIIITIPANKKEQIIKDLNILGINSGFIYADVKSRSSSILG